MIRTLLIALSLTGAAVQAETFRLAATTSFNNSGLSDVLLPAIARDIGLDVQLLVVGTGQAIRLGSPAMWMLFLYIPKLPSWPLWLRVTAATGEKSCITTLF